MKLIIYKVIDDKTKKLLDEFVGRGAIGDSKRFAIQHPGVSVHKYTWFHFGEDLSPEGKKRDKTPDIDEIIFRC